MVCGVQQERLYTLKIFNFKVKQSCNWNARALES